MIILKDIKCEYCNNDIEIATANDEFGVRFVSHGVCVYCGKEIVLPNESLKGFKKYYIYKNQEEDFKVIIAGSREFNNYNLLKLKCDEILKNKMQTHNIIIISGTARGTDLLGEKYAEEKGFEINRYPADWNLGKRAGYIRNTKMAENADALIALNCGTRGTNNMIEIAKRNGLLVRVISC
jgi:hypothetical protein